MKFELIDDLVAEVWDGATVAVLGAGGGILEPTQLIEALARRFEETGSPRDLTIVHTSGLGDGRTPRGLSPLAQDGLVRRFIGGHFGLSPALKEMVADNRVEAYNLPQGVLSQLYREEAAGRRGLLTDIGLGSFIDPRQKGGALNERSVDQLVQVVEIDGEELLFYRSIPIDFALIRGSYADDYGNLSLHDEPYVMDSLELASAAHRERDTPAGRRRGRVFAQVKRREEAIPARDVQVPGILVDGVALVPEQQQSYVGETNDHFAGRLRADDDVVPLPFGERRVVAARAAHELAPGAVFNMGVGIPDGVASMLRERGDEQVNATVEHGVVGGTTATGAIFGACVNHEAVVPMPNLIDLYQGGLLDAAFLGFAQVDRHGNVNVSRYGTTVTGTGGFIDISQNTRKMIFCGTLTAGGLKVDYDDGGRFSVVAEGRVRKFVDDVEEICFDGRRALERGQEVLYVTERAVFRLTPEGLALIEVAPGLDIETDLLPHIDFDVIVDDVTTMPAEAFRRPAAAALPVPAGTR